MKKNQVFHKQESPFGKKLQVLVQQTASLLVFSKSIRAKLILAFLVPVVLIILLGFVSYSNTSGTVIGLATKSLETAMKNGGKYLDLMLDTIETQADQIVTDIDVQNYYTKLWNKDDINEALLLIETGKKVNSRIMAVTTFNHNISEVMILSGVEGSSSFFSNTTFAEVKDSPFVKKLEENPTQGAWFGWHKEYDSVNDNTSNNYSLSYIKLVRKMTSMETVGLLIINVKPDAVIDLISGIDIGESEQIFIITADERVILNGETVEDSDIIDQPFFRDIRASAGASGTESVVWQNSRFITSYYKVGDTGIILMGMTPESKLNAAARTVIIMTVIVVVAAVIIALAIGYFMANNMRKTINLIVAASGQVASGDLTSTLTTTKKDEFGKLTSSINSMISNMRALIEQTMAVAEKADCRNGGEQESGHRFHTEHLGRIPGNSRIFGRGHCIGPGTDGDHRGSFLQSRGTEKGSCRYAAEHQ